jgi:GMP synthase (glutamine-hydrolysing)
LPEGAKALVTGDRVTNQAFRYGELAWGTQFHFEVDASEIAWWLQEFGRHGDLETDWGKSKEQVLDESALHVKAHEDRGREIFTRFTLLAAGS